MNQATYAALGPVIGCFLPVVIPRGWTIPHGKELLEGRKESFGLSVMEHNSSAACFTMASTMGDRIGSPTALANCPNVFICYSKAAHYSVKRTVSDKDLLTARWSSEGRPRFGETAADDLDCMTLRNLSIREQKTKLSIKFTEDPMRLFFLSPLVPHLQEGARTSSAYAKHFGLLAQTLLISMQMRPWMLASPYILCAWANQSY